ncbi:MAG: lipopolysaccharide kinase InaA family protein [Longimicrobiales bacterium]
MQPAGYRTYAVGSALLVTRPDYFLFLRDALHAQDSLYAYAALLPEATLLHGRGATYRVGTPHGDWVVRRCRRGGAVAWLLGDRYVRLGAPRQLRELMVSEWARSRGVRTPEVKAVVLHATRWFVRSDLATGFIAGGEDLAQLAAGASTRLSGQVSAAWSAAGRLVRELAAAGLSHPDLHLKNIIIRAATDGPEAWVLDLDRAQMGRANAAAMWLRLQRSLAKWERTSGRPIAAEQRAALEAGYHG